MAFSPKEVLFSPAASCNLNCPHCITGKTSKVLPASSAVRFLNECKKLKIKRVGFTGGEPFLAPDFLCTLTKSAVKNGMLFDRIMTNGVWYKGRRDLETILGRLYKAGYDGDICISVDKFHRQKLKKLALFIESALSIWKRPDVISIASVVGSRDDSVTRNKLNKLAGLLKCRLAGFETPRPYIKGPAVFIKIFKIKLSPIGKAGGLKRAWSGRWFGEDFCKGPGNVFFVEPSGDVKSCCGYASDAEALNIGNIKHESAAKILKNAGFNRFVRTIFNSGLGRLRKRLENRGVKFPGKTDDHCYFCNYVIKKIPERILRECLDI